MNSLMEKNYKFGESAEKEIKPMLERCFGCDLNETNRYAIFDFEGKKQNILFEVKKRRNKHLDYPSTMIGMNKVSLGLEKIKEGFEVYFIFIFTDGVYYYELDYKTYDETFINIYNQSNYYFIPIEQLNKLEEPDEEILEDDYEKNFVDNLNQSFFEEEGF